MSELEGDNIMYVELPKWTYNDTNQSIYDLVTAIVLAGHENKWIKIRASQQREILGNNTFGKKMIGVFDGQLHIGEKVCFGADTQITPIYPDEYTRYESQRRET